MCGGLKENGPQGVALLGGVALLDGVGVVLLEEADHCGGGL